MIKPTVGRVVLFQPSTKDAPADKLCQNGSEPLAAIVTCVWSDSCINLAVFDANGQSHNRTSVPLIQGDTPAPTDGFYAHWMPYQISQAAKESTLV